MSFEPRIAPSILSADIAYLARDLERISHADLIHVDVMDGHFVPNLSFGIPLLEAADKGPLPVDVHLMVEHPEDYIDQYARAGAKIITVHAESTNHLHRALQQIRAAGCLAGVALNPATSPECLRYVMGDFDLALVMTVNPGFGGQKLIHSGLEKIAEIRSMLECFGKKAIIEVDGGINEQTAALAIKRGATMLVAGSALFGAPDAASFIANVKALG